MKTNSDCDTSMKIKLPILKKNVSRKTSQKEKNADMKLVRCPPPPKICLMVIFSALYREVIGRVFDFFRQPNPKLLILSKDT